MRIVDVIENNCECKIFAIRAALRGGEKILYSFPGKGEKTVSLDVSGVPVEMEYSPGSLGDKKLSFIKEMLSCLLEIRETWDLQDELSRVAEKSEGGRTDLDELISQTLNTLVCSHLFDKTAVMFFNGRKKELRAVQIAGIPPYTEEQIACFRAIRVPASAESIIKLAETDAVSVTKVNEVFEKIDKIKLKNEIIVSPLVAGKKVYGVLVTYSEGSYGEKHVKASQSTARFITAMISAALVYKRYRLSTLSEKKMSQEFRAKENLLALGSCAAIIAHEIKNPLVSIGGFAKRIMKAINDPSLQRMASIISTESERLERLTEDILSFSKKQEPRKEIFSLNEEFAELGMLFENRCSDASVELLSDLPDNVLIEADRYQFRQVMVNLIANAMNAIEKNGTVTIGYGNDGRYDVVTVTDTGSGIPEENLPSLFRPFFTTSSKGTGLGLAISKKILINHGGDISVKNTGSGAEFALRLPRIATPIKAE